MSANSNKQKKQGKSPFSTPNNGNNKPKFTLTYIYLLIGFALVAYWLYSSGSNASEIDNNKFSKMVVAKDIDKLEYVKKDEKVNIYLKEEALKTKSDYEDFRKQNNFKGPQYYIVTTDYQVFNENLRTLKERAINNALANDSTLVRADLEQEYEISTTEDNTRSWGLDFLIWGLPLILIFLLSFFPIFTILRLFYRQKKQSRKGA